MQASIEHDIPCSSLAVDSAIRLGSAGLLWGWCIGGYDANKLGLNGVARVPHLAQSVGRFGFQWALVAAIFSSTRCGMQRYRRTNDWVNAFVGGAAAGLAIGAGTRNWKQVAGVTGFLGIIYHHMDSNENFR
ncbi:hypothetical protein Leryth_009014 [Lithospermum erythrorhizon]|nr:hypothetical protein Leryth_009014 [Lithospermum erythrorhizon]